MPLVVQKKTFCLNALMDYLRSQNFIVLSTAASGVASKLVHNASLYTLNIKLISDNVSNININK